MDIKSQAKLLNQLIVETEALWNDEIMHQYPQSIEHYPKNWLHDLSKLSTEDLFQIDSKQSFAPLGNSDFKSFCERIQKLSSLPFTEKTAEIPLEDWAFIGVKFKKRHEIQKMVPHIKKVVEKFQFAHINDIGGGVGHLSRILSHYHSIPSFSIDQNVEFQEIGKKRLERFRKLEKAAPVTFINAKFGNGENQDLDQCFTKNSFSVGLHTCGSLAVKLIDKNIEKSTLGLLNFGCCYYKMTDKKDILISDFYKKNNFKQINLYGLTLATRSHSDTNFAHFKTRLQVKNYRYGLHLFLIKYFSRNDMIDVGECPIQTYDAPFSHYILIKLKELNLSHHFTVEEIESFYHSKVVQEELKTMFLCNIIRWQLGRALEVFILIDRALYLEENGYQIKIEQYFEEELSPRNIGILALKNI